MSKFSKHREKPKWTPKEGALVVINANGCLMEISDIEDINGERRVSLEMDCGGYKIGNEKIPVRDVIDSIRSGIWRIVKDGPIEPEKILKQFKFI